MKIAASSKELPAAVDLIEQIFGADLSAIKKMLSGVSAQGQVTLIKTVTPSEIVTVDLTITP